MFNGCKALTSIPAFDVSNVKYFYYCFAGCSSLEEIHMTGMKYNLDISFSTKFTESALIEILNNLGTAVETNTKLIIGSTNLAKLTDEDGQNAISSATEKGWIISEK
jgi:surface protein